MNAPVVRPKRYPTRTCVACRTSRQKRELVRVVRTPEGRVIFDDTGRLAGRGAYLCRDGGCWRQGVEKGSLQRALEHPLPEELKTLLRMGAATMGTGEPATTALPMRTETTSATMDAMNQTAGAAGLQAQVHPAEVRPRPGRTDFDAASRSRGRHRAAGGAYNNGLAGERNEAGGEAIGQE